MSSKIRELTFNEAPTEQIRRAAISEGMRTLYWDGIDKVLRGVTTLEEVFRVAKRTRGGIMNCQSAFSTCAGLLGNVRSTGK